MNIVAVVVLSITIALAVHKPKPPERHHIYWCSAGFIVNSQFQIYGLPCMYRTNNPIDV